MYMYGGSYCVMVFLQKKKPVYRVQNVMENHRKITATVYLHLIYYYADWEFCFDMLNKVSRSFAIVIEQLGDELRNTICVFYLILRGLDTIGEFILSKYSQIVYLNSRGRHGHRC